MMKTEKEMRDSVVPKIETPEQLTDYIKICLDSVTNSPNDDDGDAYGRAVYAMSLSAVAAFHYVAHTLGVTGFQASCADLDILKRLRHIEGPFGIYKIGDMLYPQYDLVARLNEFIADKDVQDWLKEQAQKKLDEETGKDHPAHPEVLVHWKKLAGVA